MDPDAAPDRDSALKAVALVLAAGVFAVGLTLSVGPMAGSASAQVHDFSVPDASFTAETADEVYITFEGPTVSWSDTPEPVEEFDVRFSVEGPDGDMQQSVQITCHHENVPAECGFERSTSETVYLDAELGPALISSTDWTSEHFSPEPGDSVSHTIQVAVELELEWEGGSHTETASDSTTITVTHPDEE